MNVVVEDAGTKSVNITEIKVGQMFQRIMQDNEYYVVFNPYWLEDSFKNGVPVMCVCNNKIYSLDKKEDVYPVNHKLWIEEVKK